MDKQIKQAYIDSYDEYGQNLFDRYVTYADHWLEENDYRDSITGLTMSPAELEKFLEEVEVPANVSNKKDFRNEVVKYCLRYRTAHEGKNPKWSGYNKIREVLEAKIFSNIDEMLPIISSNQQSSADERKHHKEFVERMVKQGYTSKQVNVLVDWYLKSSKE
jgi:serine protein kinase